MSTDIVAANQLVTLILDVPLGREDPTLYPSSSRPERYKGRQLCCQTSEVGFSFQDLFRPVVSMRGHLVVVVAAVVVVCQLTSSADVSVTEPVLAHDVTAQQASGFREGGGFREGVSRVDGFRPSGPSRWPQLHPCLCRSQSGFRRSGFRSTP